MSTSGREPSGASPQGELDPVLLAHARGPRGTGELQPPRQTASRSNPLCGDEITVDVRVRDGRIAEIAHRERACALTVASASVMVGALVDRPVEEVRPLAGALARALVEGTMLPDTLAPLGSARLFPARRRCVLLPWEALLEAI